MPEQHAAQPFLEAIAPLEAARQQAHKAAQEQFERDRAEVAAEWHEAHTKASQDWERVKSDPTAKDFKRIKDRHEAMLGMQPNLRPARTALGQAIRAADDKFYRELAKLRQRFGVVAVVGGGR